MSSNFFRLAILLLVIILLGANFASSAIDRKTLSTIEIAYMNGYVEALKLDLEIIKLVKSEKALLQESAAIAAGRYLDTVEAMNKPAGQKATRPKVVTF